MVRSIRLISRGVAVEIAASAADTDRDVVAHIAECLPVRAGSHGQHRDQHAHRTGYADQDREYRAAARGETPEIEPQQGSRLAQEIHDVLSSARPVRSKS